MSLAGAIASCSVLLLLLLRAPVAEGQPSDVATKMERIMFDNGCRAFAGLVAWTTAAGEAFSKQLASDRDVGGGGTGLTIFCPDDNAVVAFGLGRFKFNDLTSDGQVALLLYHGVARLYSEEALQVTIGGEVPTLASGPGDYNITIFGDTAILSSSLNHANITKKVVDKDRLAVYLIDSVLVPREPTPTLTPFSYDWKLGLKVVGIIVGILALITLLIGLVRLVCWLRRSYQDFAAAHASAARVAPDG